MKKCKEICKILLALPEIYLRNEFHFSVCKVNELRGSSCVLCEHPNLVYTSINIGKIKFIAYICIGFNQNLDEKSLHKR